MSWKGRTLQVPAGIRGSNCTDEGAGKQPEQAKTSGPGEAGKMGIQQILSQAQQSAALVSWEEDTEGKDSVAEQSILKLNYVQ